MKKIVFITLIVVIFLLSLTVSIHKFDWSQQSKVASPDGNIIAFYLWSNSEAGAAPYGDHIVLIPAWMIFGQYFKEPIFAGYCEGGVQYQWKSNSVLYIKCNGTKIMKQIYNNDSVVIEYDITSTEPSKKSIQRVK